MKGDRQGLIACFVWDRVAAFVRRQSEGYLMTSKVECQQGNVMLSCGCFNGHKLEKVFRSHKEYDRRRTVVELVCIVVVTLAGAGSKKFRPGQSDKLPKAPKSRHLKKL